MLCSVDISYLHGSQEISTLSTSAFIIHTCYQCQHLKITEKLALTMCFHTEYYHPYNGFWCFLKGAASKSKRLIPSNNFPKTRRCLAANKSGLQTGIPLPYPKELPPLPHPIILAAYQILLKQMRHWAAVQRRNSQISC